MFCDFFLEKCIRVRERLEEDEVERLGGWVVGMENLWVIVFFFNGVWIL